MIKLAFALEMKSASAQSFPEDGKCVDVASQNSPIVFQWESEHSHVLIIIRRRRTEEKDNGLPDRPGTFCQQGNGTPGLWPALSPVHLREVSL